MFVKRDRKRILVPDKEYFLLTIFNITNLARKPEINNNIEHNNSIWLPNINKIKVSAALEVIISQKDSFKEYPVEHF